jgi:farnesyl diphosphate synthase
MSVKNMTRNELQQHCAARLEKMFAGYVSRTPALLLKTAMERSLLNGGKHLRPLLIYATGNIFNAAWDNLDVPACAVELIHTYSLIHDDLPCMDNADLRRGKATCHKIYGDGIAVLTGDALHTLAMQIIAGHPAALKAERRVQMINVLSTACGPFGMAAGQTLDLTEMSDENISADLLLDIYRLKTGALFSACIELGRLASHDEDEINQHSLHLFGQAIGLAFQIQDDILDLQGATELLGKQQGIDHKNNKITYPKLLGVDAAKEKVTMLYLEALEAIDYLGNRAQLLRELTQYMLQRNK